MKIIDVFTLENFPRPLIRVMIRLLDPQIGERFDDGACGPAGFLCEAYKYLHDQARNDPKAYGILQHKTFTGGEEGQSGCGFVAQGGSEGGVCVRDSTWER